MSLGLTHLDSLHIGIDLGGTKTEVAVLAADSTMLFRHRVPTPSHDYRHIITQIADLVALARQRCGVPTHTSVGVAIPGCVDAQTQRVRGANTQVLNGQALQQDLERSLACPVFIENDANCLALSESVDGAAANARVVFAVILGTGCGGGITWSSRVWRGRNALAGEWGHNPLPWPSEQERKVHPCWCGQVGCIETWISGPAFARDHADVCGQQCTPQELIQAMRGGDAQATQSFERYAHRLARALAQVTNLLDPDVIVLGGGMSQVQELYTEVPKWMKQFTFTHSIGTQLVPSMHGDSSGVRGAAWLSHTSNLEG